MTAPPTTNLPFTLLATVPVLLIPAGFSMLETGLCRAKNVAHILMMNLLAVGIAVIGCFVSGYALSTHTPTFFLNGINADPQSLSLFILRAMAFTIALVIPIGALAERWSIRSFLLLGLFLTLITYPIYAGWIWASSWLSNLGAIDLSGSSAIHLQGATVALIGAFVLGPRIGKYDAERKPRPLLGHHIPMTFLGTLLLFIGLFSFNLATAPADRIAQTAVNNLLSAAAAILTSCFYMWFIHAAKKPDPTMTCNGLLAGLVAIAAGGSLIAPWMALIIGAVAGLLVVSAIFFLETRGIDDPVGVIATHGAAGLWGTLAAAVVGTSARQLLIQLIAVLTCIAWNLITAGVALFVLRKILGSNRVPPEVEIAGLDIPEVGVPAYPEFIDSLVPDQIPASEVADARSTVRQLSTAGSNSL